MAETTTSLSQESHRPARFSEIVKRLFDIAASLLGLLLLAPAFIWLAWLVHRDSPGPVFYHGERVGRRGKLFKILKFRTMHEEAASYAGPRITVADDVRVTPVGKWLRDTKLNELPQLWNVLKGDMSLVGPRMISPPEMIKYGKWGMNLLTVKPGLTGLWQVSGRSDIDYQERVRLDMHYIRNWTIWQDLYLIVITLPAVLKKKGAY